MKGPDGRLWWSTAVAVDQLQVTAARIRDWVRRSKVAGHLSGYGPGACPACLAGRPFPHVDAGIQAGRHAAYVAEQLLEVEAYTAASRRGQPRATGRSGDPVLLDT